MIFDVVDRTLQLEADGSFDFLVAGPSGTTAQEQKVMATRRF